MLARDWETLYREYFPKVRNYFVSNGLGPHDADDLAQELFTRLASRDMPQVAETYIHGMARSMLTEYRGKKARSLAHLCEYINDAMGTGEIETVTRIEHFIAREFVEAMVAQLPPTYAETLRLKFLEHLGVREIARRMRCTEEAVCKRLQRARRSLQRLTRYYEPISKSHEAVEPTVP